MALSIEGLIFEGFWAQRPEYIRLLGYYLMVREGLQTAGVVVSCSGFGSWALEGPWFRVWGL